MRALATALGVGLLMSGTALAGDQEIESAMSAAPESLAGEATIMDWDGNILREGTNGWTCLPDRPDTGGTDPWCVNDAWSNFLDAYIAKKDPSYTTLGVAYMLAGDTPVSNTDPYETEFTNDADWVKDLGSHLMIVVPGEDSLKGYSTDPKNGGPWIMWPGTPYEHLMIPIDNAPE